jgi:hypothetical protein
MRVEGLFSPEGESLPLRSPVELLDNVSNRSLDVEVWMSELERQMRLAMRDTLRRCGLSEKKVAW